MKLYYRAMTHDSKTIRGLIEAKDEREAAYYLRKHQLIPIKIIPSAKTGIARFFPFLRRTTGGDLIFFTRQLASMLNAGLTLMQALTILKNQIQNPIMSDAVYGIVSGVENGKTFSSAIEKYPNIFSPIYIALIRSAESSGLLDKVLVRLADNLDKQQKLKNTIKSALLYPAIIVAMMIVVIIIMMVFVVPQLTTLYQGLNASLPLPTVIIVSLSKFIINFWLVIIASLVIGSYYFRKWYKKESGRRTVDGYLLKLPIFGKLLMETMMAEFSRSFGILVSSGSLVVDSLIRSSDVVNNVHYKQAILLVAKRVEKGIAIGNAMEASPLFPPMVVEMVKIGEQTGKLDESLIKVSEYYEREVDQTVKTLTTLLEPIIMIILAVGVGFLIIAVITPIYNLLQSIR